METAKTEISKYCQECVKHTQGNCDGMRMIVDIAANWGTPVTKKLNGLLFCKRYEFDVRLYEFADSGGNGKVETLADAKRRGKVNRKTEDDQEAFDDFDLGASLSSADLENLI